MDTPEHYKHYTSMQHGLSWTPINDKIININTNAVVIMDVYDSNATGLSLQFGMNTMHLYTWAQYSMNDV